MQRLIISAPFGNYIQPKDCTPTLGTFTALPRPGRIRKTLSTVRYYRRIKTWVNRLGLRNPGIEWLHQRVNGGRIQIHDKIVSIHGIETNEWPLLIEKVVELKPLAIELNLSCPNVGEVNWPSDLFANAVNTGVHIIAKIPPVRYQEMSQHALDAGIRIFHCCNTLPIPAGGISGKPLKPVALQCIYEIRRQTRGMENELTIIGGGGITQPADVDQYREAGANYFAIGTKVFNPRYLFSHRGLFKLIERANQS